MILTGTETYEGFTEVARPCAGVCVHSACRGGGTAARRRAALRDRCGAADLRLPRHANLRRAAARGAALLDAAAFRAWQVSQYRSRCCRELERVAGPADLHVQAAPEREIP